MNESQLYGLRDFALAGKLKSLYKILKSMFFFFNFGILQCWFKIFREISLLKKWGRGGNSLWFQLENRR
jgi:hypothetical protein